MSYYATRSIGPHFVLNNQIIMNPIQCIVLLNYLAAQRTKDGHVKDVFANGREVLVSDRRTDRSSRHSQNKVERKHNIVSLVRFCYQVYLYVHMFMEAKKKVFYSSDNPFPPLLGDMTYTSFVFPFLLLLKADSATENPSDLLCCSDVREF